MMERNETSYRPKVQSKDMLIQYLNDARLTWLGDKQQLNREHQLQGSASTDSHSPKP